MLSVTRNRLPPVLFSPPGTKNSSCNPWSLFETRSSWTDSSEFLSLGLALQRTELLHCQRGKLGLSLSLHRLGFGFRAVLGAAGTGRQTFSISFLSPFLLLCSPLVPSPSLSPWLASTLGRFCPPFNRSQGRDERLPSGEFSMAVSSEYRQEIDRGLKGDGGKRRHFDLEQTDFSCSFPEH